MTAVAPVLKLPRVRSLPSPAASSDARAGGPRGGGPRGAPRFSLADATRAYAAVRIPRAIDPELAARYATQVTAARDDWTTNFGGAQFTLGRAWYTHLETGREDEYFADAAASNARVERACPGLAALVTGLVEGLLSSRVRLRPDWCGPGVHIFPAGSEVARKGGEPHYDTEGQDDDSLQRRPETYSFVLMLQPPDRGGALRVWDQLYDGEDFPEVPGPEVPCVDVEYGVGELVAFDAYRLHQIRPFGGMTDRISATVHAIKEDGVWNTWF